MAPFKTLSARLHSHCRAISLLSCLTLGACLLNGAATDAPPPRDTGYLDVTQAPFRADNTGQRDATLAIQQAVYAARDMGLVCYFPAGTYLVSDTISCEQPVEKMAVSTAHDGTTQHYWGNRERPCILMGPGKGPRPVLRLQPRDDSFADPENPKPILYVWAQTRNDVPGRQEPIWGKQQANISFNNIVRGIDLDIRGQSGAVGLQHAGSQGSTAEDITVYAEGAFSGLWDCPGQGGGTYNVEVIGGDYGIYITPIARFPLLVGCAFRNQAKAAIHYQSVVMPIVMVGFEIEKSSSPVFSLDFQDRVPGVILRDGSIELGEQGSLFASKTPENLILRDVYTRSVSKISPQDTDTRLSNESNSWSHIATYASSKATSSHLLNGKRSQETLVEAQAVAEPPPSSLLRGKHIWNTETQPNRFDADAVNLKDLGAAGDGVTDDTAVLQAAIAKHQKIFLPKGVYTVSDTIELKSDTILFGVARLHTEIRAASGWGEKHTPILTTVDDKDASAQLSDIGIAFAQRDSHLSPLVWRAGRNSMLRNVYLRAIRAEGMENHYAPSNQKQITITGSGGGRWFAVNAQEATFSSLSDRPDYRALLIEGTTEPLSLYAVNAERLKADYYIEVSNSAQVDIYYLKTEATVNDGLDCRTNTILVRDSQDVGIWGINGNVRFPDGQNKRLATIENSRNIWVAAARTFRNDALDYLVIQETLDGQTSSVDGQQALSLYRRQ